ncbi:MAG: hypothetical protein LBJ18_02490 [Rickettsiales bacterium]|jgi:hypothetical protein|nr:hypothetical protein [Rickettsiales bacterium]
MQQNKTFSSENILLSVAGHLALVALMLTTLHFAIERAKLVAPDRVQIMEIDLSKVEIAKETSLFNTAEIDRVAEKAAAAAEKKQDKLDIEGDEQLKRDAFIAAENKKKEAEKKAAAAAAEAEKKDVPKIDAPRSHTIVRVNRETGALNRTMTISVVDALRVALTRCWVIDKNRPGMEDIRAVAHLTMNQTGTVADIWFEGAARADSDATFAYVLETIRGAVSACQPFRMLPASEFAEWRTKILTFYPNQGTVM